MIIQFSTMFTLSQFWTYESIASEALVLTNTIDNEKIQLDNVRYHINSGISYLANLLNLASSPWYGIWGAGIFEPTQHFSGLEWCNLQTAAPIFGTGNLLANPVIPPTTLIPARVISDIKRINFVETATPAPTDWIGNCTRLDISQLTQLNSLQNMQWRHSIAWGHHGTEILFFVGSQIGTTIHPKTIPVVPPTVPPTTIAPPYTVAGQTFVIWGYRKPVLDNMVASSITAQANNGGNYRTNIDLPDEYAELLIKMVQKKILEQIREQVPAQLEQEINQGLANINQMLTLDIQLETSEREKRKYGSQQQAPGAVG